MDSPRYLSQYLKFAAATVSSLMVYCLYCMVDGLFVARGVGEYAMSAVNLALPYTNVLFSLSLLFGVGTSTILAMDLGQGRKEEANRLFSQNTAVVTAVGLVLTALVFVFFRPFLRLLGTDSLTYAYTREYLLGLVPFSVFFIISYNMEILIKTDGFPQKAFRTVIAGCLLNCVLDYLAIFPLKMGVFGAALATGLSQLFVCVIYFHHFLRCKSTFRLVPFPMDWSVYKRLLPIGLADGVTELCTGIMIFLFNRVILRCLGTDGLVSYTIIAYANTVVVNALVGTSSAAQPLVSYRHGKGDERACRKFFRYAMTAGFLTAAAVFLLLQFGGMSLVRAFLGKENEVLNLASQKALRIYSLSYLLAWANVVIGGYLTAREKPVGAMVVSVGRGLVWQALALLLLSLLPSGSAIWYAPLIGEGICLIFSLWFLRKSKFPKG